MSQFSPNESKSNPPSKFEQLIIRVTKPTDELKEVEQQYQARFLASLLLAFILLAFVSIVIQLFTVPDFGEIFPVLGISLLFLGIAYYLSRTIYFLWGVAIAIATPTIAVFVNLVMVPSSAPSISFVLIGILLSSVLLPWIWTFILVCIDIVALMLVLIFVPTLGIEEISTSLFFVFIVSSLILVIIGYRDGLENRRQAELMKTENRYRMLISQSPFSTVVYSPEGRPIYYNRSAINLWDVSEKDLEFIQANYIIFEDKQLEDSGVLAYVKMGFSGQSAVAPPAPYIFERYDVNGRLVQDERWIVAHCYPILDNNDQVIEVVIIHEDITERLNAAEELEQRNQELTLLNRVISMATTSLKRNEILHFVGREMASVFGVTHAISGLFNDEKTEVKIASAFLPSDVEQIVGRTISLEPFQNLPVSDFLYDQSMPLHIQDVQTTSDLTAVHQLLEQLRIHSMLILPLVVRDKLIGVIALATERPHHYSQAQINLVSSVASSVSQALQNAQFFEEVQQYSSKLEERVAKRTSDLEEANQKLQALANAKDEFVSNVSHELRTPIGNIKLYHDLLTINPQKQEIYLATLQRETARLEHVVESLLHLSRLDQGTIPMRIASVDFNALAEIHVTDRLLKANKRNIEISFEGTPDLPKIEGDVMQLGQVLGILLTNALNYSPDGSQIVVQTEITEEDEQPWLTCKITDMGPGIPQEEIPHLFERFFRGKAARTSKAPGTGLGLSIAKEIMSRHNGHIHVESDGIPGNGTTVRICLPVSQG